MKLFNMKLPRRCVVLTLSPQITTKVEYVNSLYADETPSNSASLSDPNCLTLKQHVPKR